jgi:DNA repair exonuclease SbcCD ATPase subunit
MPRIHTTGVNAVAHCNRNKRLRLFQTPNSAHGTPIGTSDVDQNVELNLLKAKFRALAEKLETNENELSACKSQLKETKEEKFNQEKKYEDCLATERANAEGKIRTLSFQLQMVNSTRVSIETKLKVQLTTERENVEQKIRTLTRQLQTFDSTRVSSQKKFDERLASERQKAEQKVKKITSQLETVRNHFNSASTQLSAANKMIGNFVTMYERNDPKAAADILVKELSAKKVPFENIVTGIMTSLLTSRKASVKYISSFIEEEAEVFTNCKITLAE